MFHAVGTANKHYLFQDTVKNNANIAHYINNMMQDTTTTEDDASTSQTKRIGKVAAWLATTEEDPQSLPGTSGSGRKMWNEKEEEILVHVTRFLPREENLPRQQIIDAVEADEVASAIMPENGGQFSQQQIREIQKYLQEIQKKIDPLNLNILSL